MRVLLSVGRLFGVVLLASMALVGARPAVVMAGATGGVSIKNPGLLSSLDGDPVRLQIHSTETAGGGPLTYSAIDLPDGLSITAGTGVISGILRLPPGLAGTEYAPYVTVSDSGGATASVQFYWQVSVFPQLAHEPVGPMRSAIRGMCVDGGKDGAVRLQHCDGRSAQSVTVDGNYLRIHGRCIDNPRNSTVPGARVRLGRCDSAASVWLFFTNGAVEYLTGADCLDAASGRPGTPLTFGSCDPQHFRPARGMRWLVPATAISTMRGGKCVGDGNSIFSAPVSTKRARIWNCSGAWPQDWTLLGLGGPVQAPQYGICVLGGSACLLASRAGAAHGVPVLIRAGASLEARWVLGRGGHLIDTRSGKCLDDPRGRLDAGTGLNLRACASQVNQRWALPQLPVSSELPGSCLAAGTDSTGRGQRVRAARCADSITQRWALGADGTFRALGRCLTVTGSGTADGTRVSLRRCNRSPGQQWRLGLLRQFVNPHSGKCLDIPGPSPADNTQLVIWNCRTAIGAGWHIQ